MPIEKKVRFSAEDNFASTFNKMKRDAEDLSRGLIKDARQYTTSGKETLAYIEEQIKAIERRNKLEKEGRITQAQAGLTAGTLDKAGAQKEISSARIDARSDTQQIRLLREIIETIRGTSRQEIREDRINVEKQIKGSDADRLGPRGDEFKILKETLQRQYLGDIKSEETGEKQRFQYGKTIERGADQLGGIAGSRNELYAVAAIASGIPIVGRAVSGITQRGLSEAEGLETITGKVAAQEGKDINSYVREFNYRRKSGKDLGLSIGDFYERFSGILGASGDRFSARGQAGELIAGGIALDIDQGSIESLVRTGRGARRGSGTNSVGILQALRDVSEGPGKTIERSLVPEYLKILVDVNQQQLGTLVSLDQDKTLNAAIGLAKLDPRLAANPELAGNILKGFERGLSQSASPGVQALQYRAAAQAITEAGGTADLISIRKTIENPLANEKYLPNFLRNLAGRGLNRESQILNLSGAFGFSTEVSELLADSFNRDQGNFDFKSVIKGVNQKTLRDDALNKVGTVKKTTAATESFFEEYGSKMVQNTAGIIEKVKDLLEVDTTTANNTTDMVIEMKKANERVAQAVEGSSAAYALRTARGFD